ncbi:MAG: DUF3810 domain-containing protein [Lachnospiraceae bacterium]|nr:DUF3810 domain-containing protein [Lachnospiraceae bacterium]
MTKETISGKKQNDQGQNAGQSTPVLQVSKPERNGLPGFPGKLYIGILLFTVLLNGFSWSSTVFCDNYVRYVFPLWVNTYGRFSGAFPFSVGEILIFAGLVLVFLVPVGCVLRLIARIRHSGKYAVFFRRFMIFFAWVLLIVALIMTLNCFLLYHTTSFSEKYLGGGVEESPEDFLRLRNKVAERCHALSAQMERDERGYIVYSGSMSENGEPLDMQDKAREEMRRLGERYPQLAGYYPRPKAMLTSDFLCQQYTLGWYFPFSMEANYNDVAYVMNLPSTMCHELAHLKGFIYEDEANFIGYLACIRSEDPYFQYSGYLSVLGYLERDLEKLRQQAPAAYERAVEQEGLAEIPEIVYKDDIFVTKEEWDRIEAKALFRTETVSKATDTFVDTTLKVNGVADGKVSYSRVVKLMLEYEALEEKAE